MTIFLLLQPDPKLNPRTSCTGSTIPQAFSFFVCLFVCLFGCLFICLFVCLFLYFSLAVTFFLKILISAYFQLDLTPWKEKPLRPQHHSGQDLLLRNSASQATYFLFTLYICHCFWGISYVHYIVRMSIILIFRNWKMTKKRLKRRKKTMFLP